MSPEFNRYGRSRRLPGRREIHQPAVAQGANRVLLRWSMQEAGEGCIQSGIVGRDELSRTLDGMRDATEDPNVLVLMPRMSLVWARK